MNTANDARPEPAGGAPSPGAGDFERALTEELERRIGVVSEYPAHTFGTLRALEFLAMAVVTILLPLLAVRWAR